MRFARKAPGRASVHSQAKAEFRLLALPAVRLVMFVAIALSFGVHLGWGQPGVRRDADGTYVESVGPASAAPPNTLEKSSCPACVDIEHTRVVPLQMWASIERQSQLVEYRLVPEALPPDRAGQPPRRPPRTSA